MRFPAEIRGGFIHSTRRMQSLRQVGGIKEAWLCRNLALHRPLSGRWQARGRPSECAVVLIRIRADPPHEVDDLACDCGRPPLIAEHRADAKPDVRIGIAPSKPRVRQQQWLDRIARRRDLFTDVRQLRRVHANEATHDSFAAPSQLHRFLLRCCVDLRSCGSV